MHLYLQNAAALAGFAAAALDVKAETSGAIAAHLGVLRVGKQRSNVPEHTGISGRVGARCAPNGRLVDADDLVHPLHALDGFALAGAAAGTVQRGRQRLIQNLIDQRGFAGTGHAGHADHLAQREIHSNVLQVVLVGFDHPQELAVAGTAGLRHFHILSARKIRAGDAALDLADVCHAARSYDLAAVHTGTGADIHNIISLAHGILIVFDHDQGVAQVAQALHGGDQFIIVALVQADARLVQHVQHTGQRAADLGGQADTLALTARQGCRAARQGQIAQTYAL